MAMAVLFQCLLCVKLYECHIKYAGRFLDIKEISNIPDCHDIGLATTEICQYLICLQLRDRSNNITTKLYDKRDAFGFHIVNFPFMSSNIPSAPAYGVYASQLVRYARCCSNYSDFLIRHRALVKTLLSQG